jgi:hypothetical protein
VPFATTIGGVNYFQWKGKTLAWLTDRSSTFPLHAKVDFLLVSKNSLSVNILHQLDVSTVILDQSNSRKFINYISAELRRRNVPVISLEESAFILK